MTWQPRAYAAAAADVAPVNLADLVSRHAADRADAVALVQPAPLRRSVSWAELDVRVTAVASALALQGLIAGHRVALLGGNSIEFVVAYLAALRAGYVVVPINPRATDAELTTVLRDSGARLLLSDVGRDAVALPQMPLPAADLTAPAGGDAGPVNSPQDREALAVLLYTAGTSGEPRAAMLTHRALLTHVDQLGRLDVLDDNLVALAVLPMFHVFGLNAVLGSAIHVGGTTVICDGLPADVLDLIVAERITNLPVTPAVLYRLLQLPGLAASLTGVVTVVSGAAPLPQSLSEAFTATTGLRVEQGYGLTEAAPGVTATFGGPVLGAGHVGRPLPGVEIRIDDGAEPAEPGEVWIRGDNLFSGYWPDGNGGPGADGWFATGDIGYLLDGELHLVDRSRELIGVSGFNVYPAEVEAVILGLDGVRAAAVVGRPDPATGEQVVAFVVADDVGADQVLARCAERLPRFKRPAEVHFLPELPRGATGKIKKGTLRRLLVAGPEQ